MPAVRHLEAHPAPPGVGGARAQCGVTFRSELSSSVMTVRFSPSTSNFIVPVELVLPDGVLAVCPGPVAEATGAPAEALPAEALLAGDTIAAAELSAVL